MDELGSGLHGVEAEVPKGVNAPARAIARLEHPDRYACALQLTGRRHSRHSGTDYDHVIHENSLPAAINAPFLRPRDRRLSHTSAANI
jgi:hypothetical protein